MLPATLYSERESAAMDLIPFLWAAGVIQVLVAASNVPAARMFGYQEALRAMPTFVAEVFVVQNVFIMFT